MGRSGTGISMTDTYLDFDLDLESLFETDVPCTSRSEHTCSGKATHACATTFPCPDNLNLVHWCANRVKLHAEMQRRGVEIDCAFCHRSMYECWRVWAI